MGCFFRWIVRPFIIGLFAIGGAKAAEAGDGGGCLAGCGAIVFSLLMALWLIMDIISILG